MERHDERPEAVASSSSTNANSNCVERYESFENFLQTLEPLQPLCNSLNLKMEDNNGGLTSNTATDDSQGGAGLRTGAGVASGSNGEDSADEIKCLQELVQLLQVRLDALQNALEMQEHEVCREVARGEGEKCVAAYERLLSRWRREVCLMLLKQRVDALQVEQKQLQHTQKEQHLIVQLHEARALVEVLKQKERNSQAEIAILTTSTKLAKMNMKEEGERKRHEMEDTLKGVTKTTTSTISHMLESHSNAMALHLGRMSNAACRLDMYGKRVFFSEQQVAMAAGLISNSLTSKPQGLLSSPTNGCNENFTDGNDMSKNSRHQRETMTDHDGRTQQLEALLAATKTQLADECVHARELQERIVKCEMEARESVKRAGKKLQEQADRDLAAIKRQHSQSMQSLQQKLVRIQAEQAKTFVTNHQLEHKISQQQREFAQLISQKDSEFKKALDAKETEVSALLGEQNALLVKLKRIWHPVLNSSSAKIFNNEKISTPRNPNQAQEAEGNDGSAVDQKAPRLQKGKGGEGVEPGPPREIRKKEKPTSPVIISNDCNQESDENYAFPGTKSCYTQTPPFPVDVAVSKKRRPSRLSGIRKLSHKVQRQLYPFLGSDVSTTNYHHNEEVLEDLIKAKEANPACSELSSTTSKKVRNSFNSTITSPPTMRQRMKDEDLITSYLLKLQKSYINSISYPSKRQDLCMTQLMMNSTIDDLITRESQQQQQQLDYDHEKEDSDGTLLGTSSPFTRSCPRPPPSCNQEIEDLSIRDPEEDDDGSGGDGRRGGATVENEWLSSMKSNKDGTKSSFQPSSTKRVCFREVPVVEASFLDACKSDDILSGAAEPQFVICIPRGDTASFSKDQDLKGAKFLRNKAPSHSSSTSSSSPSSSILKVKLDSIEALSENLL